MHEIQDTEKTALGVPQYTLFHTCCDVSMPTLYALEQIHFGPLTTSFNSHGSKAPHSQIRAYLFSAGFT